MVLDPYVSIGFEGCYSSQLQTGSRSWMVELGASADRHDFTQANNMVALIYQQQQQKIG